MMLCSKIQYEDGRRRGEMTEVENEGMLEDTEIMYDRESSLHARLCSESCGGCPIALFSPVNCSPHDGFS